MYERFFNLRERPFDLTPDPRFLFLSTRHHEALTHLKYGLSGRPGITLLIGDAGTGKSTLIRATLQGMPAGVSRIAVVTNPTLDRDEFYEHLGAELGFSAESTHSKTAFLNELEATLETCGQAGGVVALIVDEAQSLPDVLLEELRLLTNVGIGTDRSLTLVLAGQPELSGRLNEPGLRQLKQRIALRAELMPFTLKETAGYIATRITTAGGRADQLFTRDAVVAIHAASKGLPRVISVLCDNALVSGFAAGIRPVGSAIVADVCTDFDVAFARASSSAPREVVSETVKTNPVESSVVSPSKPEAAEKDSQTASPPMFSFFRGARR